jgi:O-antigen/teichoic acid export membrane protein
MAVRVARNSGLLLFSRFGALVGRLALVRLAAPYLGPSGFGLYALLFAMTDVAVTLATFGLGVILVRESLRDEKEAPAHLGAFMAVRAALCLALAVPVLLAVQVTHPAPELAWAIRIMVFHGIGQVLLNQANTIFLAYERLSYQCAVTLANIALTVLLTLGAVRMDLGLLGVLGAATLGSWLVIPAGLLISFSRFMWPSWRPSLWRFHVAQGIPVTASNLLSRAYSRVDIFVLGGLRGKADVGIFNGAYGAVQVLMELPEMILRGALPVAVRLSHRSADGLALAYQKMLKLMLALGLPVGVFLALAGDRVLPLLLGPGFGESALALRLLTPMIVLTFPNRLFWYVLLCANRQTLAAAITGIATALNLALDLALVPHFGVVGACVGTSLAEASLFVMGLFFVTKHVGDGRPLTAVAKPAVAALVMGLVMLVVRAHTNSLWVLAPGAMVSYWVASRWLRIFTRAEIAQIRRLSAEAPAEAPIARTPVPD